MSTEARPSAIAGRGVFTTAGHAAGRSVECDGARLNHSCDPSLGWSPDGGLVALRDLAPDEELTVDYATSISDPDFTMYCHCGTYRCRQLIEGSDWRIPQLQQRYAGHWSPAVQALIHSQ